MFDNNTKWRKMELEMFDIKQYNNYKVKIDLFGRMS